eukprot:scpid42122/ scgid2326/ MCM domain-containing protein 2
MWVSYTSTAVCFTAFQTLELLPSLKVPGQLHIILRLTNIPQDNCLTIRKAALIRPLPACVVQVQGRVYSKSPSVLYTQSACYHCPTTSCPGADPYRYIRLHCPGASEADTVRGHFECDYCGQDLQEDVQRRVLSDLCHIQLISSDITDVCHRTISSETAILHRVINIILRDELANTVSLGETYRIAGQLMLEPEKNPSQRAHLRCTMEAIHVQQATGYTAIPPSPAANDKISKLKQACAYSPWAFPATVAYSFAGQICPPGVFHRLKLALLLSLVTVTECASLAKEDVTCVPEEEEMSVINSRKHGLHLLSISSDDLLQSRLMTYASQFSPTCMSHNQATSDLFGTVSKEPCLPGCSVLCAGSLFLATGGICLLGNLSHYKKDSQTQLQHVLEGDCAIFSVPFRDESNIVGRSSQVQQVQVPLKCAVWAYADQKSKKKHRQVPAATSLSGKPYFDNVNLSKALVDRFDMVVSTQSGSPVALDLADAKVCDMLLEASCSHSTDLEHRECLLDDQDTRQLIQLAAAKRPTFAKGSQDLIRSFYMASRQMRSSGAFGTDIPATAIHSMTCVAAAHAALCLRSEVTEDDATAAILLFEESMVACFGSSVLNVSCQPHFRDEDLDAYLGEKHCEYMKQFQSQLHHFCAVHGTGVGAGGWEE